MKSKSRMLSLALLFLGLMALVWACAPAEEPIAIEPVELEPQAIVDAITKGGCSACHVIPGVPGAVGVIGPDLSSISAIAVEHIADGS